MISTHKGRGTYASGGFGSRSTFSIVRMSFSGSEQKKSGFCPGTLKSSSVDETGSCPPKGMPKPIFAEAVATYSRETRRDVNLMVMLCLCEGDKGGKRLREALRMDDQPVGVESGTETRVADCNAM